MLRKRYDPMKYLRWILWVASYGLTVIPSLALSLFFFILGATIRLFLIALSLFWVMIGSAEIKHNQYHRSDRDQTFIRLKDGGTFNFGFRPKTHIGAPKISWRTRERALRGLPWPWVLSKSFALVRYAHELHVDWADHMRTKELRREHRNGLVTPQNRPAATSPTRTIVHPTAIAHWWKAPTKLAQIQRIDPNFGGRDDLLNRW